MFPQSYYIPVAGREESKVFTIITEISDQLDPFCSTALAIYACHFIHPPCDPDRGTYLPLHTRHTLTTITFVKHNIRHIQYRQIESEH